MLVSINVAQFSAEQAGDDARSGGKAGALGRFFRAGYHVPPFLVIVEGNIPSQEELAALVGVSRQTISSIETGQFNPTAKLALLLCVALDKKFEDLFYFE